MRGYGNRYRWIQRRMMQWMPRWMQMLLRRRTRWLLFFLVLLLLAAGKGARAHAVGMARAGEAAAAEGAVRGVVQRAAPGAVPGVVQGENAANFTAGMPLATIWVDESVFNTSEESRNRAQSTLLTDCPGFLDGQPGIGYSGSNFLVLNLLQAQEGGRGLKRGRNEFSGDIIRYTYPGAAEAADGTRLDVAITYSDLAILLPDNLSGEAFDAYVRRSGAEESDTTGNCLSICSGNMLALQSLYGDGNQGQKYAMEVTIRVAVVDPDTGEPVGGTFYFPMVDIDVARGSGWGGHFPGTAARHYYSEQLEVIAGRASALFIPGGDGKPAYRSGIEATPAGGVLFFGNGSDENTFYSGFATLADNTEGIQLRWRGCGGHVFGETEAGLESYLMAGSGPINHRIRSSTGEGGAIWTTVDGNLDGTLAGPEEDRRGPGIYTTATGQTMVYTMTPAPGYRLRSVTVHEGSLEYALGEAVEATPVDADGDGAPDYYTFAFRSIHCDNAIHVEWAPASTELAPPTGREQAGGAILAGAGVTGALLAARRFAAGGRGNGRERRIRYG